MPHYCNRCKEVFDDWSLYRKHMNANHNFCRRCKQYFDTGDDLKEHFVQSPLHFYCQWCNKHVKSGEELIQHHTNDHYYCETCRKVFKFKSGREAHYRESSLHHYCSSCDRHFLSASNLRNHLNSETHLPRSYHCLKCELLFISWPAVLLHLEAGTCSSGIGRNEINDIALRLFGKGFRSTKAKPTGVIKGVDGSAWTGMVYKCHICHDTYRTLAGLNQHLASPRHQGKIFSCPRDKCASMFSTLSGLAQHLASGKCANGIAFNEQGRELDEIIQKMTEALN